MKNIFICLVGFVLICGLSVYSHKNIHPKRGKSKHMNDSPGDRLILTPLIQSGKIGEARELALVKHLTYVKSYSGYFTVNPKYNGNMFFWFFPAANVKAPLLIWLQGGPGVSSLFGLFVENGPFIIDVNKKIHFRKTSWTRTHSVIYFDNPVGTGFSFTDDGGYAKNDTEVAGDLYDALIQFFTLFPEYQPLDFYVTGESYAGKYIPALSYKIHMKNQNSPKIRINLKGMAIGGGFTDPEIMVNFGEYLYTVGLLDRTQLHYFQREEEKAKTFIKNSKWIEAFQTLDTLIMGDLNPYDTYFTNTTGFTSHYNILYSSDPPEQKYYTSFLEQNYVKRAIHVGNTSFVESSSKVISVLREDYYKSVKPWLEALLNATESYKIMLYSSQLDLIVPYINTDKLVHKLQWNGGDEFKNAMRKIWRVCGKHVAGYVTTARNFTELLIRNAGHIAPFDQPKWTFDMINRFTAGIPFA